ncbi:SDR family NAD(P)-dependent oxidoreductase [Salipiger abyssi]|uniref:SDR family NAD(P)-dependent oxidoreductase n=1 Tax=Salipiger abyssi TaxID=1250539 RepID=UPI000976D80F|nr:SDR family NAD(P)-dependent oxidoreductase [Salipiger abyssi]
MSLTRSIIVTGGNSGLGLQTARHFARDPATEVIIGCRSAEHGLSSVAEIKADGGHATWLQLDLASQASVRTFVEAFHKAELPQLYALICNAGSQNVGVPAKTKEGYETTFAVNHLGHYLLSRLLLPDIVEGGRITIIASGVHDPAVRTGMPHPSYSTAQAVAHDFSLGRTAGLRRYTTSKLCNVMYGYELARRLAASDNARLNSIRVNILDPGLMPATGLARSFPPHLQWVSRNLLPLLRFVMDNVHRPEVSAQRVADITTGPMAEPGNRYFSDGKVARSSVESYDERKWLELWESSAAMTGLPDC